MNQRRWFAVAVAVGLCLFSVVISFKSPEVEEKTGADSLNSLLYGSDKLVPTTIEEGDSNKKIVRLSVEGAIIDSNPTSFWSQETYNHQKFLQQIETIKDDTTVQGVLLEVNSPGGGVYESAEIAKEIKSLKKERDIPIYVSMKNLAASGGYYISAAADKIYATEETTTGSIGVIMSGTNYSGLMEKLGIKDATYKSGDLKDMGSGQRPVTDKDKEVFQSYIDSAYARFVKIVSDGRKMPEDKVKKIADGRIYDGKQAKENGLVDEIGYPEDALEALRKEQHLKGAEYVEFNTDVSGFANTLFGAKLARGSEKDDFMAILENLTTKEAPKAMYYYGGE
ncbi:MAG: signal peptide peptidase SppA [Vagococcus sp.]|uniref:signal peptide peptidase SppA n=1 Tax=Vagococcus sp. TaxID=1933889 RepID=UPI002FCB5AB1